MTKNVHLDVSCCFHYKQYMTSNVYRCLLTGKSEQHGYDCYQRNPLYCRAQDECLWELQALTRHYHPTVSLYAGTILQVSVVVTGLYCLVVGGVAVVVTSLLPQCQCLCWHHSAGLCCGRCGLNCMLVGGVAVVVTSFISLCVLLSLWTVWVGCRWCCCCCHIITVLCQSLCGVLVGCWCCCCCHILHRSLCAVIVVACIVWVLVVLLLLSYPSSVSLLWFMAVMLDCCSQKKGCVLFSGLGVWYYSCENFEYT